MSYSALEEATCSCGEVFETELYQSITIREDPEMKEMVMGGRLNVVKCPACKQLVYIERFVLYHDADTELLAFVYPKAQEAQEKEIRATMGQYFAELQKGLGEEKKLRYQPCLIFGLDVLCDLIRMEEELSAEAMVVEALCDSLELAKARVRMDAARRNHVPPLLPAVKTVVPKTSAKSEKNLQQQVISGLKRVLDENPHLVHYREFLEKAEKTADWTLRESDLLPAGKE